MRVLFGILAAATTLSVAWTLFLFHMYPMGFADYLFGTVRSQLAEEVSFELATRLTSDLGRQTVGNVQDAIVLVAIPLVVVSVGWAALTGWLLFRRSSSPERASRF